MELMSKRAWASLMALIIICAIVAGAFVYKSKCRGIDACAAATADGQERIKPDEVQ